MGLPQIVAKIRLEYHLNMLDVVNVGRQIHVLPGEKAEALNENHFYKIIECYDILGDYDTRDKLELVGKLIKKRRAQKEEES